MQEEITYPFTNFNNANDSQCSKLVPVHLPEADNFGGGPGTFLKIFFNSMFMIWDSRQEDWQIFWLSFEHCDSWEIEK